MTIGERVLLRRQQMGISRRQLSRTSGVHETTLYHIEYGNTTRPSDSTVARIASALNVPLSEFELEKQRKPEKKRREPSRYREAREHTGRTLERAAEELRIRVGALGKIEAGLVPATRLQLIHMSELYGRTVGWLVGSDDRIYAGRRCAMGAPCGAGKVRDFCCADCPERADCRDRCLNDPARCGLVKGGGHDEKSARGAPAATGDAE
jgi:transcriptional regulator with XRE-family HTH domain